MKEINMKPTPMEIQTHLAQKNIIYNCDVQFDLIGKTYYCPKLDLFQ